MSNKSVQQSNYSIRFNAASVRDDDDDIYDIVRPSSATRQKRDVLSFELQPTLDDTDQSSACSDMTAANIDKQGNVPNGKSTTLSVSQSIISTPVATATAVSANDVNHVTAEKIEATTERSLFSDLKERFVRRHMKSGSADSAKIATEDVKHAENVENAEVAKNASHGATDAASNVPNESNLVQVEVKKHNVLEPGLPFAGQPNIQPIAVEKQATVTRPTSVSLEKCNRSTSIAKSSNLVELTAGPGHASSGLSSAWRHLWHWASIVGGRRGLQAAAVALFAFLVIVLPAFLSGLIIGSVLTTACVFAYRYFVTGERPVPSPMTSLTSLPPMMIPQLKASKKKKVPTATLR